MAERNRSTGLADKLFPDIHNEEVDVYNIPPEKRRLNTETYDFTVSTLNDYIEVGHIEVPRFQRGYVWNKAQASRLIESLIINCPIPVIYLSQNSDETLSVIDGNQRINSINHYLNNGFDLKGLSAYPELEGFKFDQLDPRLQRHILNRTVRCIVILKDTHPQIKFDVFERLNTGSVKLTSHELRHGVNPGKLMDTIDNLAQEISLFKELTLTKKDKRMKAEELILRFLALMDNWRNYEKPLVTFLNNYSENNKNIADTDLDLKVDNFNHTLSVVYELLGKLAFKTYDYTFKNAKFNAALYDAQMIAFYEMNLESDEIDHLKSKNFAKRNLSLLEDDNFSKYISSGTTDKNSVLYRIEMYKDFVKSILEEE